MGNMNIVNAKGIYVFIFRVLNDLNISIGSLGMVYIPQGLYGYIGSARGFGGVKARVLHHIKKNKKRLWWHIDYLTTMPDVAPLYIVFAETVKDIEYSLSQQMDLAYCWNRYIKGFGSSDKDSYTHLYLCKCNVDRCIIDIVNIFKSLGLVAIVSNIDDLK
jgi:Uri superfamily endonuclease